MIEVERASGEGNLRIQVRPNRSLTPAATAAAYAIICVCSLTVAGAFAWFGLWVPLPFAGGELALLGGCLVAVNRQRAWNDEIVVSADEVRVRQIGRGRGRSESFHTGWVRVEMRRGRHRGDPRRLILSCYGRELEVGSFLNEKERERLAGELKQRIGTRPLVASAMGSPAA